MISAPPRPCRSNCCSNIGARPTPRRKPQPTSVGYVNLTGKVEVSPTWTVDGIAHVRIFDQKTQDGNPTGTQPCDGRSDAALLRRRQHAGQWPERHATRQSVRPSAVLGENDRTTTRYDHDGLLVAGDQYRSVVRAQQPLRGRNQLRLQRDAFHGQRGAGHYRPRLCRQRQRNFPRPFRHSRFRSARSSLRTTNQYTGLYALDTFDVTNAFAITGGGRFNVANINLQDQIGTALNGNDTYTRFNPIIGGTYKITSGIDGLCRLFRSQPRADPAGTGLRRSRASLHHRLVPGFRSAVETGRVAHRGSRPARHQRDQHRHAGLEARRVPCRQHRRHPRHSQSVLQGFGYFQNVGSTRRQGIEAEVSLKSATMQICTPAIPSSTRVSSTPLTLGSQQPVRRRQRQHPGPARQPDPGGSAQPAQGRHRLFGHRRVQGRRRRALRQQPVFRRRRIQPVPAAAVLRGLQPACFLSGRQDIPDLCARGQHLQQSLRDLRNVLRHRRACPISPMAARRSPIRVRSARRGRAPSMPA